MALQSINWNMGVVNTDKVGNALQRATNRKDAMLQNLGSAMKKGYNFKLDHDAAELMESQKSMMEEVKKLEQRNTELNKERAIIEKQIMTIESAVDKGDNYVAKNEALQDAYNAFNATVLDGGIDGII